MEDPHLKAMCSHCGNETNLGRPGVTAQGEIACENCPAPTEDQRLDPERDLLSLEQIDEIVETAILKWRVKPEGDSMIADEDLHELIDLPVFPFAPVSVPKLCTSASPPSVEPAEESSSIGEKSTAAGAGHTCLFVEGTAMMHLPRSFIRVKGWRFCPHCGDEIAS